MTAPAYRGCAMQIAVATAFFTVALNLYLAVAGAMEQKPSAVFAEVSEGQKVPEISLRGDIASSGERLLIIEASNFTFTDLCVGKTDATHIGHAHIHQGDRKIGTAYSPIFSLGTLPPGTHEFVVTLRTRDHRAIVSAKGLAIEKITFVVRGPEGSLGQ
ncbi:hypothetical protein [Nitratireductor sp. XY-223]|uniref:hypothetical protein n=1 Tax=Nitratireductor sp. XY-223 TaxID=2561926 RepID=UPI0010AA1C1E|nr:hypothetical protein [Nitratireductor sp. XY-223]